jgi:hypothetical protein
MSTKKSTISYKDSASQKLITRSTDEKKFMLRDLTDSGIACGNRSLVDKRSSYVVHQL